MKTLLICIALLICSLDLAFAQSERLQSGDSIRIALERTTLSKELTQLRDSINQSLKIFDSRIKKARAPKRVQLENARRELIEYQKRIKLDLEETSVTGQNAWREESVKRIQANTIATRREYKRIRTLL